MTNEEQKRNYIIRYLIFCAEKKVFLQYDDIRKIFGVSGEQLGLYAEKIGDYCLKNKLPLLNALIVNKSGSVGAGWQRWAIAAFHRAPPSWEDAVNECFKFYHIPQGSKRFVPYNAIPLS